MTIPPELRIDLQGDGTNALRPRGALERSLRPIYAALILAWLLLAVALPARHLIVAADELGVMLGALVIILWGSACLRMRGLTKSAMALESCALLSVACLTFTLMSFVVATTAAPLADGLMAGIDDRLFPSLLWPDIALAFCRHPLTLGIANFCYASIKWQGTLLVILCCMTGRQDRSTHFILAWMATLAIVIAVFTFLPCLGAYAHYGIMADQVPGVTWYRPDMLVTLRTGEPIHITLSMLDGIIEFPSFHTAAAILLAWGFWAIRWARWPAMAINLGMVVSAVPVGGHYFIDIPAGAIVAMLGIALPVWLRGWSLPMPLRWRSPARASLASS